jgi:hypothetical protein
MLALCELIALKRIECTRLRPQVTTVVDTRALNAVCKHTHRVKGQGMMPRDGIDLSCAVFRGAEAAHSASPEVQRETERKLQTDRPTGQSKLSKSK